MFRKMVRNPTRLQLEDARLEGLDVEALLRYAEFVMEQAARLWIDASVEQRIRSQSVLFPEGLRFRDGRFGTAVTCFAFASSGSKTGDESGMASQMGADGEGKVPTKMASPGGIGAGWRLQMRGFAELKPAA